MVAARAANVDGGAGQLRGVDLRVHGAHEHGAGKTGDFSHRLALGPQRPQKCCLARVRLTFIGQRGDGCFDLRGEEFLALRESVEQWVEWLMDRRIHAGRRRVYNRGVCLERFLFISVPDAMIKSSLLLLCAAAILTIPTLSAQSPSPTPTPGKVAADDDNYVLALSAAGKEGEGVALIVTWSQTFNVSRGSFTFNGTLSKLESGAFRLDYLLETHSVSDGTIHTGSSVILRPGEPVQLVKNGDQFYNLRLDRYTSASATKGDANGSRSGPGIGFMR